MDTRRAWAEIDLDAIEHNIKQIRKFVRPETRILGVVKANAYGHGFDQAARTLMKNGVDYLGVACIDEAMQLRKNGFRCPILILGYTSPEDAPQLVKEDITATCCDYELASVISRAAVRQNKRAKIHLKIDTGMSRLGLRYHEDNESNQKTVDTIYRMAVLPNLDIEGIFTHFAAADDDDAYTELQFSRFEEICNRLKDSGLNIPVKHCCNSAAMVRFPKMHMDMVRPGIILYGQKPAKDLDCGRISLRPAMQLKARVTNVKTVEAGVSVSYGRKFVTEKETKLITVSIGYGDGYSRVLSQKAEAIVNGTLCKLVGNICMDQCMIDATGVNTINIGDEVILFGKCDDIELPVESLAEKMGTINYEILCLIGKRVPRIYTKSGKMLESHSFLFDA